ncbi:MAG TPA: O-antigen ligase family protein [Candidatus Acidoferrum sp.]|nr:O-antigen ligase family protein [Candidatus Acidoferrum sp.]
MKILRFGLYTLLAFAVLAHGGVEDWARAVLETGAGILFLAWAARFFVQGQERISFPSLLLPLSAFFLLVCAQWFFRRTASSFDTRIELQLLLADLLILFVAAQIFQSIEDWRGFFWFIMIFGFLVSGFGILQHLTFNGKLYWFREMRYGGVPFGPYVNRNHFAGFAELVIPTGLVPLVLGKVRRERRFVVGLLVFVPLAALLLCASRGGIVSVGVELCILTLLLFLRRSIGRHALAGAAVLALAMLLVSWLGVKEILARFGSLQTLEVSESKRASMRKGTWRIFLDHPLSGTGFGTLQIVYPLYETQYDGKIVNHSHNDYLEALAETGILGGLCCAWYLGLLFFQGISRILEANRSFVLSLNLSGLVACCGFLTHSLVDFNLHIPSNALLFFLMGLLATIPLRPAAPLTRAPTPGHSSGGNP